MPERYAARYIACLPDKSMVVRCQAQTILDVKYLHLRLVTGDDLFVTEFGLPFLPNLLPDSFYNADWFRENSVRLDGTSCVYKVRTRAIQGRDKDIVLKWNRMAQDVPGATHLVGTLTEFNSPFEEFALVMEMRNSREPGLKRLLTHKPLGIYVPAEKLEPWQLGRKDWMMQAKIRSHEDVALDNLRNYAVLYEWIKGMDAAMACQQGLLDTSELEALTSRADDEMARHGFIVSDRKPHHIIVRKGAEPGLLRHRKKAVIYGLIDFELLHRTPVHEQSVRSGKRSKYLALQANRFTPGGNVVFPAHIKPVNILGVDYVQGPTESSDGALWVVGRDPELFDYFLPERWRKTPRTKLSVHNQTFHTVTKDNINLVWSISRVGETPDVDPFHEEEKKILDHGHNSPFEEMALAIELSKKGIPTTYPRAIYMTGHESEISSTLLDKSRYTSHRGIVNPDGTPVLLEERDYITIWGFWNGPDKMLAMRDGNYYKGIDALRAFREGLLSQEMYLNIMQRTRKRLLEVGVEDLSLRGNHLLLSIDSTGKLVHDSSGGVEVRICNFDLLRRLR